jgi:hypothetical protein
MDVISAFIINDTINIDVDPYRNKSRIELIDVIQQLKIDVSHILGTTTADDSLMDHPLVNQYNDMVYEYHPFNAIVDRYPTSSVISTTYAWITELLN